MSLLDALLLESSRINVWIAVRSDGIGGTGTIADPFDGSSATKFDALMNDTAKVPANSRVHLGPGTFETKGFCDNVAGGWQARAGIKIVGSGIDVTTLKLVGCPNANEQYFAVGHALGSGGASVDAFEISELTVDCNLAGQSVNVAAGAVRIKGTHSRIRRIKVKNWGTKSSSKTCYVIATIIGDPTSSNPIISDAVIDECIAVDPGSGNIGPVVVLHAGGKGDDAVYPEATGEAAVIRYCFVDGGQAVPLSTDIRALSVSWCHGTVVEGNQIYNVRYGGPFQNQATIREVIVRNNFFKRVVEGPSFKAKLGPSTPIALSSLTGNGTEATATTTGANLPQVGDRLKIVANESAFSGFVQVTSIDTGINQFKYKTTANGTATSPTMQKVMGIDKLIAEGNTVELAQLTSSHAPIVPVAFHVDDNNTLIPAGPPYPHGQVILRDNRIRYEDGFADASFTGYGSNITGVASLIERNNVLEITPADPLKTFRCGSVNYFNNTDPGGTLIRGYDGTNNKYYDELSTDTEDAFVLALFKKG